MLFKFVTFLSIIYVSASCTIKYQEENSSLRTGIDVTQFFKTHKNYSEFEYSLFRTSSLVNIRDGKLYFENGGDREWLCTVKDEPSLKCNCKQKICSIVLGIHIQAKSAIKNEAPTIEQIKVCIEDKNDNHPKFPENSHTFAISSKLGSTVALPVAIDKDSSEFSNPTYNISCNTNNLFALLMNHYQPYLKVTSYLGLENRTLHQCHLEACENKFCDTFFFNISISDRNHHEPIWNVTSWIVSIYENTPNGTVIAKLSAFDFDINYNQLTFSLIRSTNLFRIGSHSGEIRLVGLLDFETMVEKKIFLSVIVVDNGIIEQKSATGTMTILVEDVNDNQPVINLKRKVLSLDENVPQSYLGIITVNDLDSGPNGNISCNIFPKDKIILKYPMQVGSFYIFHIYTTSSFDYEAMATVRIKIICEDMGQPKLRSEMKFDLQINDIDDNNVKFIKTEFAIGMAEQQVIGSFITQLVAIDKDSNTILEYFLTFVNDSALVNINQSTGVVTSNQIFDREVKDRYKFGVMVREKMFPNKTDSAFLLVTILDVNDNEPKFNGSYIFNISENANLNTEIGQVFASDPDLGINGTVQYFINRYFNKIDENYKLFQVNRKTGKINLIGKLDCESQQVHHLNIFANDSGRPIPKSSATTVTIFVVDENDNSPRFKEKVVQINVKCHSGFISKESIPVIDYDRDMKNRVKKFSLDFVNPKDLQSYIHINESGDIYIDFASDKDKLCSVDFRIVSMIVKIYDPNFPGKEDRCNLTVVITNNQKIENKKDSKEMSLKQEVSPRDSTPSNKTFMIIFLSLSVLFIVGIVIVAVIFIQIVRRRIGNKSTNNRGIPMADLNNNNVAMPRYFYHDNSEDYSLSSRYFDYNASYQEFLRTLPRMDSRNASAYYTIKSVESTIV